MSLPQLSTGDINFKNTMTPLWSCLEASSSKPSYSIPKTFQNCQFNYATSNNQQSVSEMNFQLLNVNPTFLLENCMHISTDITVSFQGTNPAGQPNAALLAAGQIASRAFPINSATTTNSLNLGGSNPIQTTAQDFFPQALLFGNSALDIHTSYSDCAGEPDKGPYPVTGGINAGLLGASRNVLGTYINGNLGAEGRLGLMQVVACTNPVVAAGVVANATIRFVTFEPIFSRVLTMNPKDTQCFIGASNSSTFRINTSGNFTSRVISWSPPAFNAIAVTSVLNSAPKLYYNTYSLPPATIMPEYSLYHMNNYQNNYTSQPVAPANGVYTTTASFQDTMINRSIYIWANTDVATNKTYSQSEYGGFEITNLSIEYGGQQSQFSNLDRYQLYDLFHKRQGGLRTFSEFNNSFPLAIANANGIPTAAELKGIVGPGSILRIPAEYITGYDQSNYTVGSQISQQITVTCTWQFNGDPAAAPANSRLFVQCVDDSVLVISNGLTQEISPAVLLSPSVIQQIKKDAVYVMSDNTEMIGGSFLSDVVKGAKTAYEFSKPLVKAYQDSKKKGGNLVDQKDLRSKLLNL